MAKRDLLTEAMADAKAVKETAIENAKAALTEAFAPHLKSMLSAKLQEIEEDDTEETHEPYDDSGDTVSSLSDTEEIDEAEELGDLDELLKEIEGESEEIEKDEKTDEKTGSEEDTSEDKPNEVESEEELNIEDMSEEDLKAFIEDVINDMIETGELEANEDPDETSEEESGDEEHEDEDEDEDEEIDLSNIEDDEKQIDEDELEDESVTDELAEAYKTIETLTSTLNEIKLLNAKLLYTNKLFKEKTLTEGKKLQILHAFEKTKSIKEAKTTYEILKENMNVKKTIHESFKGAASKTMAPITENKQPIMEVDAQYARWQKIAGITK